MDRRTLASVAGEFGIEASPLKQLAAVEEQRLAVAADALSG